jgi:LuxR family maltose regulon positive regulatory protein
VRDRDAELSLVFAAGAIADGLLDEGLAYLTHAERLAATVPDTRRRRFDLLLAGKRLWVASWRGDLRAVADTMRSLDAALSAPTPRDLDLNNDLHAAALLNLGIADLWSFRTDDARRHLERGLEASRRIGRACLKNLCLSHLALASVFSGSRLAVGIELAGEAVATIDENGWGDEPVAAAAFTGLAALVIWHGRFEETEQALERARRALRPGREPGLAFLLHHTTGALRITQGRMDDALAEFAAAEEAQALLATEHTLAVELQCHIAQAQLGGGDTAAAQATLAHIALDRREESIVRATEASIHLAEGRAAEAVEVLAPALRGPDEPRPFPWRRIKALLYDAAARRQLGDAAAARASFERAIALAEPERIVLPFLLPPARVLLTDGLPPRTAHPAMLAAILGVLNASAPQPCTETPLPDELSPAELRVLSYLPGPLTTDGIAAELYLSPNTVRTHVRRIYAKLDAHSRRQAVARARELGLLVAG